MPLTRGKKSSATAGSKLPKLPAAKSENQVTLQGVQRQHLNNSLSEQEQQ